MYHHKARKLLDVEHPLTDSGTWSLSPDSLGTGVDSLGSLLRANRSGRCGIRHIEEIVNIASATFASKIGIYTGAGC